MERVVRRRRVEPEKRVFTPKFGNPGKTIEFSVRFQPYNGSLVNWFDLYKEARDVLQKHFDGAFFEREGKTVHVEVISVNSGT